MANDNIHQEPEEQGEHTVDGDAKVIPPDTDMLTSEPKIHREHASVHASGPTVSEFTPPPFNGKIDEPEPDKTGPPDPAEHPLANPGVKDAPPHVKKQGVAFIADKLLMGYAGIKKKLACWAVLISEKKVDRLEEKGLVNRNMPVQLVTGGMTTAGAMIEEHNEQAEKLIDEHAMSKEFYDEVKPMIEEELSKRNIALTNMQMLIGATVIDLYQFGENVVIPLRQQGNNILYAFQNASKHYQAGGFNQAYAQAASQQSSGMGGSNTPPSQPEAPTPEPGPVTPAPEAPLAGNVDTALDDLQAGGQNFMKVDAVTKLPGEFSQAEALSKEISRKMAKQHRRVKTTRKRNPKKKKTTTVAATVIN